MSGLDMIGFGFMGCACALPMLDMVMGYLKRQEDQRRRKGEDVTYHLVKVLHRLKAIDIYKAD